MSTLELAGHVVGLLLVLAGLVGTFVPGLPGPPLVLLGIVVVAWAGGFERVGWMTVSACAIVTVVMLAFEQLAAFIGVKRFGGSAWGVWGAVLGAVAGIYFLPLGLLVGPLVGAVLGEALAGRSAAEAARAGWGAVLGLIVGAAVKVVLSLAMVAAAAVAWAR